MAHVVTLLEESDDAYRGRVQVLRRKFRYTRDAADNSAIAITPTSGTAENKRKGYLEAPWGHLVTVQIKNNIGGNISPITSSLAMSLRSPAELEANPLLGQLVDTLPGETVTWPATLVSDFDYVRTYGVTSQITGLRTCFFYFESQNNIAADYEFTLQVKESA